MSAQATSRSPPLFPTLDDFENGRIDATSFDHAAHVFVAWKMLQETTAIETIRRYSAALRRITTAFNIEGKYHETITWFFLLKIAERCHGNTKADWHTFKAANPDLFEWNPSIVQKYYSDALLSSETARRMFVLPDLVA